MQQEMRLKWKILNLCYWLPPISSLPVSFPLILSTSFLIHLPVLGEGCLSELHLPHSFPPLLTLATTGALSASERCTSAATACPATG